MADKLMYIPRDDTQEYTFCILKIVVEPFEHSTSYYNQSKFIKVTKVVKPTNKKTYYKALGTSVINSLLSPLSLSVNSQLNCRVIINIT